MAAPSFPPFPSIFLLLTVSIPFLPHALASSTSRLALDHHSLQPGFRIGLTHIDDRRNFTKLQLIQRAINREKPRLDKFSAMATTAPINDIPVPINIGDGEFLMNFSIGTPAKPLSAIMDTGSDLIWTQCKPCISCFKQPTPIFDPKHSSSFSNVSCSSKLCKALDDSKCNNGCEYMYTYAGDSSSEGFMAMDTLTFGESLQQISIPNIGFGCGVNNDDKNLNQSAGVVGLGRGPLSLVSQLGFKKFSYCVPSAGEKQTGSLLFGSLADLNSSNGEIKRTPLIQNRFQPSFYYLSLEGITVGKTLLPILKSLFQLTPDGFAGLIIDSGTSITRLHEDAFDILKDEFVSQTKLRVSDSSITGLDLCFDLPAKDAWEIDVPKLVFHFKGLDLELPVENYMVADMDMGLVCLAMGASGMLSIFGNYQQQNMLVIHDLEKESLSFVPTRCDQL